MIRNNHVIIIYQDKLQEKSILQKQIKKKKKEGGKHFVTPISVLTKKSEKTEEQFTFINYLQWLEMTGVKLKLNVNKLF